MPLPETDTIFTSENEQGEEKNVLLFKNANGKYFIIDVDDNGILSTTEVFE